jgi:hypothetical protein
MCNVETTSIYFTLIEEKGCRVVEQQQLIIFFLNTKFYLLAPPSCICSVHWINNASPRSDLKNPHSTGVGDMATLLQSKSDPVSVGFANVLNNRFNKWQSRQRPPALLVAHNVYYSKMP